MMLAEANASVAPPCANPTPRSMLRWMVAPARYTHRDWWPGKLARALPNVTCATLPEAAVPPLSALLVERYRLHVESDPSLFASAARPLDMLAPTDFDCVVALLGVLAWRPHLMQRVDAGTYRAVMRALPGINLAEFFARIDAEHDLARFAPPLPPTPSAPPELDWPGRLRDAGSRLLTALAEPWHPAIRERLILRLPRRAAGNSSRTVALDTPSRGKLGRQLHVCLESLENPQWL